MKIFVTGASGFIGTNFVNAALEAGYDVVNADLKAPFDPAHNKYWRKADMMDGTAFKKLMQQERPDYVLHLAARTDCDEFTTVERGYRANTVGVANVLAAVKATDSVRHFVLTSTQFVFNKGPVLPKDEFDYAPRTVYGHSKIESERLTRTADLKCGWTIVRPTNIWGPWSHRHVDTFFKAVKKGFYLHPGRKPVMRSYGYVGNVVDQMLRVMKAPPADVNGKTFYVGDAPLNLLDWSNAFSRRMIGRNVRVVPRWLVRGMAKVGDVMTFVTRKRFPIESTRFDSMTEDYLTPMDKTFAVLGQPRFTMDQAVDQTMAWLQEHAPHLVEAAAKQPPAGATQPRRAA